MRTANSSLTYRQLGDWAAAVGRHLRAAQVGEGDRVALWMEKSPQSVAAIWAILLCGAAYVPIDPRMPWRRVAAIVADGGMTTLFVDDERAAHVDSLVREAPVLQRVIGGTETPASVAWTPFPQQGADSDADAPAVSRSAAADSIWDIPLPDPESPAYVLYTSGSTGRPKGVVLSHRAAIGFADWGVRTFSIGPEDRLSNHAPFHFDLSTFDLYAAFAVGASVRLIRPVEAMLAPWLARMIGAEGITVWYSVPSVLAAMAKATPDLASVVGPQLRWMLFAGEVFPTPQLRELRAALPRVRLANLFGPTETNVCTWYEVEHLPESDAPIPIGQVCDHLHMSIRDAERNEVAAGDEGVLWIGGANLLSSYWGDAALTRERLVRGGDNQMYYNTGDVVRVGPEGNLIFLGRRDHMVKVRGYRVELGEVEAAVHALPGVSEAVVVAVADPGQGHRLELYVVLESAAENAETLLRSGLADRLPAYMIPAHIRIRADLPRTSSGKVDRSRLKAESESIPGSGPAMTP